MFWKKNRKSLSRLSFSGFWAATYKRLEYDMPQVKLKMTCRPTAFLDWFYLLRLRVCCLQHIAENLFLPIQNTLSSSFFSFFIFSFFSFNLFRLFFLFFSRVYKRVQVEIDSLTVNGAFLGLKIAFFAEQFFEVFLWTKFLMSGI